MRAFLATAEEGSMSAAARALGTTQPTLSRQVGALEAQMDLRLFERGTRSMTLTHAGLQLLEHVRAMGDAAQRVSLAATGQAQAIEGRVTVTATNVFATQHLPAVLAEIRASAPELEVEVITSNDLRDLTRREADIAIRHAQPQQGHLVARRIGGTTAHLYATKRYLDRFGRPETPDQLTRLDFIGFESPEQWLPELNARGITLQRTQIKLLTGSGSLLLALAEADLGVTILSADVARTRPQLEMVWPQMPPFDVPVWLVTHQELFTSRRIRLVFDAIANYAVTRW